MKSTQKNKVNSMTENRMRKFMNTGHRPYRLEQTSWLTGLDSCTRYLVRSLRRRSNRFKISRFE